uniref:Putative ficolin-2-like protein n=1 Tax=Haematobia irritans TaxID=7368 RepID=A0A1L8EJ54_HAEIR
MFSLSLFFNIAIAINSIYLVSGSPFAKDLIEEIHIGNLDQFVDIGDDLVSVTPANDSSVNEVPFFDIRYDALPSHCSTVNSSIPKNCAEATACTKRSGYYKIKLPAFSNDSFLVECDVHTDGGDWTVIQRRLDGSESFFRTWSQYKDGFGEIEGEYFIGLDKLHALTNFDGRQELIVLLERNDLLTYYAKYSSFSIGNDTERFILKRVGRYTGNAGDSLQPHVGSRFSTMDQDNGSAVPNMAITFSSAWWYNNARSSDLNSQFGKTDNTGIFWNGTYLAGKYIKTVKMMIRRFRV